MEYKKITPIADDSRNNKRRKIKMVQPIRFFSFLIGTFFIIILSVGIIRGVFQRSAYSLMANPKGNVTVCVDPGHGGRDPGAVSPYKDGLYEKEIVLDISIRLKKLLEDAGINVIMTRETDINIDEDWKEDVNKRPRIANDKNANLFISIHVNALDLSIRGAADCNGTEIYYFQKKHGNFTSREFADMMGEAINRVAETKYNGTIEKNLAVLRLSDMPALLIETAYLTNPNDHKLLESSKFREDMALGIFNGAIKILEAMEEL